MAAIIVVLVLAAVFAGVAAVAGGALFSLIILAVGIAIAVWLGLAGGSGMRTRDVAKRGSEQGDFLGPGGPDDPTS